MPRYAALTTKFEDPQGEREMISQKKRKKKKRRKEKKRENKNTYTSVGGLCMSCLANCSAHANQE